MQEVEQRMEQLPKGAKPAKLCIYNMNIIGLAISYEVESLRIIFAGTICMFLSINRFSFRLGVFARILRIKMSIVYLLPSS